MPTTKEQEPAVPSPSTKVTPPKPTPGKKRKAPSATEAAATTTTTKKKKAATKTTKAAKASAGASPHSSSKGKGKEAGKAKVKKSSGGSTASGGSSSGKKKTKKASTTTTKKKKGTKAEPPVQMGIIDSDASDESDGEEEGGGGRGKLPRWDVAAAHAYFLHQDADDEASSGDEEEEGNGGSDEEEAEAPLKPLVLNPPPGLASLCLADPKLWREGVLEYLSPVELVRLSHVCQHYRIVHLSNELWWKWVLPIQEGTVLAKLQETRTLEYLKGKGLMHVYITATTHHCVHCRAWTCDINILTLQPQCWACFARWASTGLITKAKAATQYLLTEKESESLPKVTTPTAAVFLVRQHVQDFKAAQFAEGYEGLLREKASRKQKAEERYKKALADYQTKKEEAIKFGRKEPQAPKKGPILRGANDIIASDGGPASKDPNQIRHVLCPVGFRAKIHPCLPLAPGDLSYAWQWIACRYCGDAISRPEWTTPKFPSYDELYERHHLVNCDYYQPEAVLRR